MKYRHDQGWRKLDFSSQRIDKFNEMFDQIKRELAHQHLWSNPCVYFSNIEEVNNALKIFQMTELFSL